MKVRQFKHDDDNNSLVSIQKPGTNQICRQLEPIQGFSLFNSLLSQLAG